MYTNSHNIVLIRINSKPALYQPQAPFKEPYNSLRASNLQKQPCIYIYLNLYPYLYPYLYLDPLKGAQLDQPRTSKCALCATETPRGRDVDAHGWS